jgi:hypothetical protein
MRHLQIFHVIVLASIMTACEKEIDIDYHTVSSHYVAEATLTQNGTTVRLTTTQDMTDNNINAHYVTGATIVLSSDGEVLDTLRYAKNGEYKSNVKGLAGNTYTVDIYADGHQFTSSSTMQNAPVVNSFRFVWKKVLSERILFADLRIQDIPRESNYYFMHIYRNDIGYRWAVMRDDNNPGQELQQLFSCCTEREMDKNDSDALRDEDAIRVEIRSIDKLSYDYLYSMQVMSNAGTNPIANFSGGCLGYFSAYHYVTLYKAFFRSDVEEES